MAYQLCSLVGQKLVLTNKLEVPPTQKAPASLRMIIALNGMLWHGKTVGVLSIEPDTQSLSVLPANRREKADNLLVTALKIAAWFTVVIPLTLVCACWLSKYTIHASKQQPPREPPIIPPLTPPPLLSPSVPPTSATPEDTHDRGLPRPRTPPPPIPPSAPVSLSSSHDSRMRKGSLQLNWGHTTIISLDPEVSTPLTREMHSRNFRRFTLLNGDPIPLVERDSLLLVYIHDIPEISPHEEHRLPMSLFTGKKGGDTFDLLLNGVPIKLTIKVDNNSDFSFELLFADQQERHKYECDDQKEQLALIKQRKEVGLDPFCHATNAPNIIGEKSSARKQRAQMGMIESFCAHGHTSLIPLVTSDGRTVKGPDELTKEIINREPYDIQTDENANSRRLSILMSMSGVSTKNLVTQETPTEKDAQTSLLSATLAINKGIIIRGYTRMSQHLVRRLPTESNPSPSQELVPLAYDYIVFITWDMIEVGGWTKDQVAAALNKHSVVVSDNAEIEAPAAIIITGGIVTLRLTEAKTEVSN